MQQRQRATRRAPALGGGLLGSLALHGVAGAAVAVALAWRTLPAPPGAEPAVEMLWLPAAAAPAEAVPPAAPEPGRTPEIATLAVLATEGVEPEDALATQLVALPPAPPMPQSLAPLPIPAPEVAEPPADPTALFAPPPVPTQVVSPPAPPDAPVQIAALPVPPRPALAPAPAEKAVVPHTPPKPHPAPSPRRAAAAPPAPAAPQPMAQPVAMPTPAPTAPEPAAIPVLSGQPRFRRPPAPPAYPDRTREAGIEGTALLRLRVGADGATLEVRLQRSSGNRWLDEAAQAAARRWDIAPPSQNGRAIEAWIEVPVRFRLDD